MAGKNRVVSGGLEAWMLDAGRIGSGWLLDRRRDWKEFSHARRSRRSADTCL